MLLLMLYPRTVVVVIVILVCLTSKLIFDAHLQFRTISVCNEIEPYKSINCELAIDGKGHNIRTSLLLMVILHKQTEKMGLKTTRKISKQKEEVKKEENSYWLMIYDWCYCARTPSPPLWYRSDGCDATSFRVFSKYQQRKHEEETKAKRRREQQVRKRSRIGGSNNTDKGSKPM